MMLLPFLAMLLLGGGLGLILAIASRRFHVEVDPRVEQVLESLPGANCGACGFPGCSGYAEAVVLKDAAITLCAPGGGACAAALARIMGREDAGAAEAQIATCACQKCEVSERFIYRGPQTCRTAAAPAAAGGPLACTYGCLGYGDCAAACPFAAIRMGPEGLPRLDEEACTGCRKCVSACPRGLMRVDPETRTVFVKCNNRDKGALANKVCKHACIACRKCEKECPFDAIHVQDNLAVIDYEKCKLCGKCVGACPKNAIATLKTERRELRKRRQEKIDAQPTALA